MPNASVTVMVQAMTSFKFYVIGEVNSQGAIPMGSRIRVLEALALAGGLTEYANKDKLILVREGEASEERYRLDYKKILDGDREHNLWIRPGDILIAH